MQQLMVRVKQIVDVLTDVDDDEVAGLYCVIFHREMSKFTKEKCCSIALDVFHSRIAISTLDDFKIEVLDDYDNVIDQDDTHESYSCSDYGYID